MRIETNNSAAQGLSRVVPCTLNDIFTSARMAVFYRNGLLVCPSVRPSDNLKMFIDFHETFTRGVPRMKEQSISF